MALWTRFFGSAGSQAAGVAIGSTAVPALLPAAQYLVNEAWHKYPDRVLREIQLAQGVASGQIDRVWATDEAQTNGINKGRFDRLVAVFDAGPGMASAFEMWRRGLINETQFRRALKRESLEQEWIDALVGLRNVLISPQDLASMRQRGYIDAAQQHDEAGKQGVTPDRADLMFENSGLPPGYGELAQMLHRGIITEAEFVQAIREANTKVKYTDEMLALSKPILTPTQAATLRLKGWITEAQAAEIGALSGYSGEQMERIYLSMGRPMAPGMMWTALARGTVGPGGGAFSKADFLQAIRQSDIRPEYGEALYAIRYAYPPLFQISRLVQGGAIDVATAVDWAEKDRYAPEVVAALRAYWSAGTTATDSGYPDKAKSQLWTTTHRSYVAFESNKTQAGSALAAVGVPPAERAEVFVLWDAERELRRRQLTPAQIKKAYLKPVRNPATGAMWTRDDALAALLERGYSTNDANTFLDE